MRRVEDAEHELRCALLALNFGGAIRERREQIGLSQEQAAHRSGLAVPVFGRLERGSTAGRWSNPTLDTLLRVHRSLGIQVSDWARSV